MIATPEGFLLAERPQLDYYDSQSGLLNADCSALEAWNAATSSPSFLLSLAFKIRDALSRPFGVRRIGGFSGRHRENVETGDMLDFFKVEHSAPDCLVLTERDRHLDVMTCVSVKDRQLRITSSVQTHNWFGRLYMLPVGIAHRPIVRNSLRRAQNALK